MSSSQVIVFDVETTGTDRQRDQVIELCVQFGLDHGARSRVWRIRPSVSMSPGAQAVHGITMEDLAGCPPFVEHAEEIREAFAGAQVLVGYNMSFDIEMLQAEYDRLSLPRLELADKMLVDAFRLWQQCEPRSLQHAHQRFVGDSFAEAHSASADVAATGRVLQGMLSAFSLADQDWDQIARVCEPERATWVGPSRHLRWELDGTVIIGFGKHEGTTVRELARANNGGYLRWILSKSFPPHVQELCKKALEIADDHEFHGWVRAAFGDPPTAEEPPAPVPAQPTVQAEPAVPAQPVAPEGPARPVVSEPDAANAHEPAPAAKGSRQMSMF